MHLKKFVRREVADLMSEIDLKYWHDFSCEIQFLLLFWKYNQMAKKKKLISSNDDLEICCTGYALTKMN